MADLIIWATSSIDEKQFKFCSDYSHNDTPVQVGILNTNNENELDDLYSFNEQDIRDLISFLQSVLSNIERIEQRKSGIKP